MPNPFLWFFKNQKKDENFTIKMKSLRTFFIIGEFNHFSYHGIDVVALRSTKTSIVIVPWGTPHPHGSSSSSFHGGYHTLMDLHHHHSMGGHHTLMDIHHQRSMGDTTTSWFFIIIVPWGTPHPHGSSFLSIPWETPHPHRSSSTSSSLFLSIPWGTPHPHGSSSASSS